jgi:hypothetical protein
MTDNPENIEFDARHNGAALSPEAAAPKAIEPGRDDMAPVALGRYRVIEERNGRSVVGISIPNVKLRIEPGMTINRCGLKRFGPRTIFLDGVFKGAPFHNNLKQQYSLDHHEGCLRPVTLSTCEQAAVVLATGLPINQGRWTLLINEPDLDAILAAWVLMNHTDLLRDDMRLLYAIMPLLRVEGVIDSYGFGKEVLSGLAPDIVNAQKERIDGMMQPIRDLKQSGRWGASSFERITLEMFDAIDRLIFSEQLIRQLLEYEELGHLRLRGQRIAVLCRSRHGIYEVETHLKQRHGKALGMIVLDQGGGEFTLRQSDDFLSRPLEPLYKALNHRDALVSSSKGEENRWGGSTNIGGSPRATGSALPGAEIFAEVGRIYGEPSNWWSRITSFVAGLFKAKKQTRV